MPEIHTLLAIAAGVLLVAGYPLHLRVLRHEEARQHTAMRDAREALRTAQWVAEQDEMAWLARVRERDQMVRERDAVIRDRDLLLEMVIDGGPDAALRRWRERAS